MTPRVVKIVCGSSKHAGKRWPIATLVWAPWNAWVPVPITDRYGARHEPEGVLTILTGDTPVTPATILLGDDPEEPERAAYRFECAHCGSSVEAREERIAPMLGWWAANNPDTPLSMGALEA